MEKQMKKIGKKKRSELIREADLKINQKYNTAIENLTQKKFFELCFSNFFGTDPDIVYFINGKSYFSKKVSPDMFRHMLDFYNSRDNISTSTNILKYTVLSSMNSIPTESRFVLSRNYYNPDDYESYHVKFSMKNIEFNITILNPDLNVMQMSEFNKIVYGGKGGDYSVTSEVLWYASTEEMNNNLFDLLYNIKQKE